MLDAKASYLLTADAVWRGAKLIHLKDIADQGRYFYPPQSLCSVNILPITHFLIHLPYSTVKGWVLLIQDIIWLLIGSVMRFSNERLFLSP